MRVAIPMDTPQLDSYISPRFGRCSYFLIYDLQTDKYQFISNSATRMPGGAGIAAGQLLVSQGVDTVVAVEVGPKAGMVLQNAGIRLITVPPMPARQIIEELKAGRLYS